MPALPAGKGTARLLVTSAGEASVEVKGSRFQARCEPVRSGEEALALVAARERAERRATHLCWAMRVAGKGGAGDVVRSHDAGEPSGTAGRPILAALEESGAWDALLTVTRIFGGVKLGAPGLKRAYHRVALDAVRAASLAAPPAPRRTLRLSTDYARVPRLERLLARHGAEVISREVGGQSSAGPPGQARTTISIVVDAAAAAALVGELPSVPAAQEPS